MKVSPVCGSTSNWFEHFYTRLTDSESRGRESLSRLKEGLDVFSGIILGVKQIVCPLWEEWKSQTQSVKSVKVFPQIRVRVGFWFGTVSFCAAVKLSLSRCRRRSSLTSLQLLSACRPFEVRRSNCEWGQKVFIRQTEHSKLVLLFFWSHQRLPELTFWLFRPWRWRHEAASSLVATKSH